MNEFIDKLAKLFGSRRFYATIAGLLVVVLQDTLGLSEDTAMEIAAIVIAWILGDSITKT
jgi:hypothetical protein